MTVTMRPIHYGRYDVPRKFGQVMDAIFANFIVEMTVRFAILFRSLLKTGNVYGWA